MNLIVILTVIAVLGACGFTTPDKRTAQRLDDSNDFDTETTTP